MNIIIATPLYPPEIPDPAPYAKTLAEKLSQNHKVTVVAYTHIPEPTKGVAVISVQKNHKLPARLFSYTKALYKESEDADVIYSQNAVASGLPAYIVSVLRKKPLVIRLVGDEAWTRATQLKQTTKTWEDFLKKPETKIRTQNILRLQRFILKRATRVIVPSEKAVSALCDAYNIPTEKLYPQNNPTPQKLLLPFETEKNEHHILIHTPLTKESRIHELLLAIKNLTPTFPDIHLHICGTGTQTKELQQKAQELAISKNTRWHGHISEAQLWHLTEQSQCVVQPHFKNLTPETVYKELLTDTPIIGFDDNTPEGVIEKNVIHSQEKIEDAIRNILTHQDLREKLLKNARSYVSKNCTWKAHIHGLETCFKSIT